jgi:hypothetical protein
MGSIDAELNIRLGLLLDNQVELLDRFTTGLNQVDLEKDGAILELQTLRDALVQQLENAANISFDHEEMADPTESSNSTLHAKWLNLLTSELFVCLDNTVDKNIWMGSSGAVIGKLPMVSAGQKGFGVGVAPSDLLNEFGLTSLTGSNDLNSDNYGNYMHLASGSVMCYIPRCYVKYTHDVNEPYYGLKVDVSNEQLADYFLPRCFVNNGFVVAGIFVDKYIGGKDGSVFVSKRNMDPVSTNTAHNPISALTGNGQAPTNTYDGMYAAVKSRGSDFSLMPIFAYTLLADLADAHYQACFRANNFDYCAFADVAPYQPKGCNNDALRDVDDASVIYTGSGHNNCGLTAGVDDGVLAKICHNGQKCGVTDVNGNMWEVTSGYVTDAAGNHMVLKESVDIASLTVAEAYNTVNYDQVAIPLTLNSTQVGFGNGTNRFFSGSSDRTTDAYKLDAIGLPMNDDAVSTVGSERFGHDGFWRYQTLSMAPVVSGSWSNASLSGPRTRHLRHSRTDSNANVGGRAFLIPRKAG